MASLPVSVLTLLLIYVLPTEGALNPPLNLKVGLLDFQISIHWLPGPGNPVGTTYSVEFTDVQHFSKPVWTKTAKCTNIITTQCDLFLDQLIKDYFVRVMAEWKEERSNWTTLPHTFQPYKDTQLSSPDMKIFSDHHFIQIYLSHRVQLVYKDVPMRYNVDLFRMTSNHTAEHVGKSTSTGFSNFSHLPSGYSYCINASAFHTEMSQLLYSNATYCTFLGQGHRGGNSNTGIAVGVLILLIVPVGIVLSAKGSQLRTLIGQSYIPKALRIITRANEAAQTLKPENVLVHAVKEYTHKETNVNALQDYLERVQCPRIAIGGEPDEELEDTSFPQNVNEVDEIPPYAPKLYSSAALMEETEEHLTQEDHLTHDCWVQETPPISCENLDSCRYFDDEESDHSCTYYIEPIESSEEDTDSLPADDVLESNYEPRPDPLNVQLRPECY